MIDMKPLTIFIMACILMGMISAAVLNTSLQPQYYSKTIQFTGSINCQGNASCTVSANDSYTCTAIYENGNFTTTATGDTKFLLSFITNGQHNVQIDCTRGSTTVSFTGTTAIYEKDLWNELLAIALILMPFIGIGYAMARLSTGQMSVFPAFGGLLMLPVKYMLALLTMYMPFQELWYLDIGVVMFFFAWGVWANIFNKNQQKTTRKP